MSVRWKLDCTLTPNRAPVNEYRLLICCKILFLFVFHIPVIIQIQVDLEISLFWLLMSVGRCALHCGTFCHALFIRKLILNLAFDL